MPPDEFEDYLKLLAVVLRVRQARQEEIFSELRDHFAERVEEIQGQGADRERAAASVLQEFGDAAALAAQFMQVVRQRRRRIIMRSSMGVVGVLIIAIAATLAFWPAPNPWAPAVIAQEQPQKPANAKTEAAKPLSTSADRDAATLEKLAQLKNVEFYETPLEDVLGYLAEAADVQFYVKKKILDDEGIGLDEQVTFRLRQVPASMILDLILEELGLGYNLQEGVVIITTRDDLEAQTITKVYNLQHCLGITPSTEDVSHVIEVITETIVPASWSVAGGIGSIQSLESPQPSLQKRAAAMNLSLVEKAISMGETATPASPRKQPEIGSPAAPGSFEGLIVVDQMEMVHKRIADLLGQLRVELRKNRGE